MISRLFPFNLFDPISSDYWGSDYETRQRPSRQDRGGKVTSRDDNSAVWNFGSYLREPVSLHISEKDDHYLLSVYGENVQHLQVEISGNILTISGEYSVECPKIDETKKDTSAQDVPVRLVWTQFTRAMTLPDNVDADRITASMEGLNNLKIVLSKKEDFRTKRINIEKQRDKQSSSTVITSGSTSSTQGATSSTTGAQSATK